MVILRALALCAVAVAAACAPSRDYYSTPEYSLCRERVAETRSQRAGKEIDPIPFFDQDDAFCRQAVTQSQRQPVNRMSDQDFAMMMQGLGMLYDSSRPQGYPVRTYTYPSGRVVTCTETPYTTNCI